MSSFRVTICLFWSTFLMKSNLEPAISDFKYLKMTDVFTFLPLNPSTGLIAPHGSQLHWNMLQTLVKQ